MDKIIIFGTGQDADALFREMFRVKEYYNDCVLAVCDNDQSKWQTIFYGIEVFSPEIIKDAAFDYIVIASLDYQYEIRQQLKIQFGLLSCQMMGLLQYKKKMNIRYQYIRNCAGKTRCTANKFNTKRIVVYTAIQGDYDDLKEPLFLDENITYVCFTENRNLKSEIWNIEYINPAADNALAVRKYKMLPHRYFHEFETSVWVDAALLVKKDIRTLISRYGKGSEFLCFPHSMRSCVYDEGAVVIQAKKAPRSIVIRQMAHYLEEGYPEDNGLVLGGCLVRNHNSPEIIAIMEAWWEQISLFSRRDQISLPYVLYKKGYRYDLCDLDLYDNEWFCYYAHKYKGKRCLIEEKHTRGNGNGYL